MDNMLESKQSRPLFPLRPISHYSTPMVCSFSLVDPINLATLSHSAETQLLVIQKCKSVTLWKQA